MLKPNLRNCFFFNSVMAHSYVVWASQSAAVSALIDQSNKIPNAYPGVIFLDVRRKEGNIVFNDALNTFYLYGVRYNVKYHTDSKRGNLLLPLRGYSFLLMARILLYAPSQRQDSTYHSFCYTSCGALAGMQNSSMGLPRGID